MSRGNEPIRGEINANDPSDRLSFVDCNSYFSSTLTVLTFITASTNFRVTRQTKFQCTGSIIRGSEKGNSVVDRKHDAA